MLVGIVVATWLTMRLAVRSGISAEFVYISAFWIVLLGLVGARVIHVLDNLDVYGDDPGRILAFWKGGLSWYGGLLGGLVGGFVSTRINKMSLWRFADVVAPAGILGLSIGRIGCTINGDAYGTPTGLPWGLVYTHPDAYADLFVAGHPAPVYEIIWNLMVFGILWRLKGRLKPDGSLFLAMVAMYSFGRFFISWVREEPAVLGPLHQAHIISLVLFVGAVALLAYWRVRWVRPETPEEISSGNESIGVSEQEQNQEY